MFICVILFYFYKIRNNGPAKAKLPLQTYNTQPRKKLENEKRALLKQKHEKKIKPMKSKIVKFICLLEQSIHDRLYGEGLLTKKTP